MLDVACGAGAQDLLWRREFAPAHIEAIDISARKIESARRHADDNLHFREGRAEEPLGGPYSKVVSLDAAYRFQTRPRFLKRAFDALEPGGLLAVADIALVPGAHRGRRAFVQFCRMGKIPPENQVDINSYTNTLSRIGFVDIKTTFLEREVLGGFSNAALMSPASVYPHLPKKTWPEVTFVALMLAYFFRCGLLHFIVLSARRPPTEEPRHPDDPPR